jgi:hypothetical protein
MAPADGAGGKVASSVGGFGPAATGGSAPTGGTYPAGTLSCSYRGTCTHPYCTTGAALDQGCAPCAHEVCQRLPLCCSALWDANCELEAQDTCGCACGVNTGGAPSTGGRASATGGAPTGGRGTGGNATGGVRNGLCDIMSSLPLIGSACNTAGESRCDASGNRCVCERGIWYCDDVCASAYPAQPTPNTPCGRGAACTYNDGNTGCACINLQWMCVGVTGCPSAANMPATGQACSGMTGVICDYPSSNPALHVACMCTSSGDAGPGATWTCFQVASCPATQPAYSPTQTCTGPAMCTYPSAPNHCVCFATGAPWVCL